METNSEYQIKKESIQEYFENSEKEMNSNNFFYKPEKNSIVVTKLPRSIKDLGVYSKLWGECIDKFGDEIEELTFCYDEKLIKLPLSNIEKIKNYLGAKIKPKEIGGQIKMYTTTPLSVSNKGDLASILIDKFEYGRLESHALNTWDFETKINRSQFPVSYEAEIPREIITKIKFKGNQNE